MGISRSFKRNQSKANYKKFSKSWTKEREYQQYLKAMGQELPKGTPALGRKPTFKMWLEITRTARAQAEAQPQEVQEFATEQDLSWDEEEQGKAKGQET